MEFLKKIAKERNLVVIIISHDTELMESYYHDNCYIKIKKKEGLRYIQHVAHDKQHDKQ